MRFLLVLTLTALCTPALSHAQAARIGRLPLLDAVPKRHACGDADATRDLRASGIVRVIMLTDSVTGRLVSVSVDRRNRPAYLMAMMGTRQDRRGESETISVHFRDGRPIHGDRSAFTSGTPSRLSDDRRGPLFAQDTVRADSLAREVVRLCS